jgi:malonyl-CoA/methylmalonyl-CoA synthetase
MSADADPADWIETAARDHPQRIFLRTPAGAELSYAALHRQSGRFAAALLRLGVVPGDRVAVHVDKSVDAVLLYAACLRMGAVFVPINVASTPNEVDYFLCDSHARIAIVRPADQAVLEPLAQRGGVPVQTLGAEGEGSLAALVRKVDGIPAVPCDDGPQSLAAIVYTSGTTGRSKGAMLTRANLASNAAALAETWHFTGDDVLLHVLPLFHVHGLFAALNTVLASGSTLLLVPNFDAATALKLLPQATVFMGVPTHYTRLLQQPGLNADATAGIRLFVSGMRSSNGME